MYKTVEDRIRKALRHHIHERYKTDVPIVTERPPKLAMGEVASPLCFELAKRLKKPPRALAQEIANSLKPIPGVARVEVAGGGYLNMFFDRAAFFREACEEAGRGAVKAAPDAPKTMVEHTSINPNKAAHIGHLRNAVLGDTFARMLRYAGRRVEVQNYIDNTGVQVADVVLGFLHLEPKSLDEVRALAARRPEIRLSVLGSLHARHALWLAEDKTRLELRSQTLKDIEEGHGDAAKMAEVVSTAIVHCHLRTLDRLGIDYDLLSRESEILHLKFWDAAFEMLKQRGAIQLATSGKNAGCWVMQLPSDKARRRRRRRRRSRAGRAVGTAEAKIIVRSNWHRDVRRQRHRLPSLEIRLARPRFSLSPLPQASRRPRSVDHAMPRTDEPGAPAFGHAHEVFNVIDSRQAYPQQVVVAGLRALGYADEADHSEAFCIQRGGAHAALRAGNGLRNSARRREETLHRSERAQRPGREGRRPDRSASKRSARKKVDERHAESPEAERTAIAHAIAIGALRYFLLRFTRSTIIAFDFKDALSFEGETGPYVQYAVVRVNGILRKGAELRSECRRRERGESGAV